MSSRVTSKRAEVFGGIARIGSPPALVFVDRVLAAKLGIESNGLWDSVDPGLDFDRLSAPLEVHLSVTERCPAGCKSCYADARPDGREPTFEELRARIDQLAEARVFSIAFGGGEASLRADIGDLAEYARARGITPTLTTSGLGVDREATKLRAFSQVNVSYDGSRETYRDVRGYDGAHIAERAMKALRDAGVPFGANTVVTRKTFDALEETVMRVADLGAVELQLVRFKPSGRGALTYASERLSEDQIQAFPAKLRTLSDARAIGIRIDCALAPFLSTDPAITPDRLARFAVFGCEADRALAAVRSDGANLPCSFWSTASTEDRAAWKARAIRPEPCSTCSIASVCRSGCRVVADYLTGDPLAPDPECPKVRALRGPERRRPLPVTS